MDVMFVSAKADAKIKKIAREVIKLVKESCKTCGGGKKGSGKKQGVKFGLRLGMVTTVQHIHQLKDLKKLIPGSVYGGQVLGCNVESAKSISDKIDAFLFLGTGTFHPLQIALETDKEVYIANPFSAKIDLLDMRKVERRKKKIKGTFMKFLAAETVGIIVSTKPGQNMLKEAIRLGKQLDKKTYIFIADTIDFSEFENYPEIEVWINTACPKIATEDFSKIRKPVLNIMDVERFLKGE